MEACLTVGAVVQRLARRAPPTRSPRRYPAWSATRRACPRARTRRTTILASFALVQKGPHSWRP
eukprot:6530589-Pyramimonas_sp.AAC.1